MSLYQAGTNESFGLDGLNGRLILRAHCRSPLMNARGSLMISPRAKSRDTRDVSARGDARTYDDTR
jgi:hypothetical protein